ncbi:protein of unknown function [Denitratisoma oestradiolicum]|uniref:Uncharacterized protein n=1 Tax=Denitratisoma oestradiolicum TaxID=311182 RepID=A0A6S6YU52_9PROT|nr:protein of unknown function [Denitratisoma oestradiolicum]
MAGDEGIHEQTLEDCRTLFINDIPCGRGNTRPLPRLSLMQTTKKAAEAAFFVVSDKQIQWPCLRSR